MTACAFPYRRVLSELVYCLLYPWVRLLQAWDDWVARLDAAEAASY